jgi:hypothetical protein
MRRHVLLLCGVLSSLLYAAMNILVPMLYEGYSSATQTVSELSAVGTPTRTLWVFLGVLYTLLITAFGWGVMQSAEKNKFQRMAGSLLFIYGLVSLVWPLAPMHQREVLAAGGKTLTDTMHILMAIMTVFLMTASMGLGGLAFGKRFRLYSIITILTLLIFGGLTGMEAPNVEANLPTPMIGVWERVNIGVFLLWVVVLAVMLYRRKNTVGTIGRDSR